MVRDLKLGTALDEKSGRLVASREGIPVILAGTIERSGSGYRVAVRTLAPDKPEPVSQAEATASDKAQVLGAVARVAEDVREALGDTTPSSSQQAETFTAGSLDAMRAYTIAQDLSTSQRDAEAAEKYREALRHDPEFGRAYSGLGASLLRLGNRAEAEKNWNEALSRTDRMTEREKLRTDGGYYIGIARNIDKAIETYEQLVAKYPADSAGYNNLAIAYFNTLNFAKALEYGRKAIDIYPKTYKYRSNYALYAMYAGDFKTAAETAQPLIKEDPKVDVPYLPLAMEALAAGDHRAGAQHLSAGHPGRRLRRVAQRHRPRRHRDVRGTLRRSHRDPAGGGEARSGSAEHPRRRVEAGGAGGGLPGARQRRGAADGDRAGARPVNAGERARARGPAGHRRGTSRRGAQDRRGARDSACPAQSRAYAKMIEGEIAIAAKQYVAAIDALNAAQKLADLWLVRFALGLAYFHRRPLPRSRLGIREVPRAARRGHVGVPRRPADVPLLRPAALLARARARDAEAGRALAVPGVPADPPGRDRRSARRRRAATSTPSASSPFCPAVSSHPAAVLQHISGRLRVYHDRSL